jgi:hypothetical protein
MKYLIAIALAVQSLSYSSGQNVSPAYEGWEIGTDGQKYFVFGYMNRNWVEEIDVPIGPENGFNIGGADQGQPTHFLFRAAIASSSASPSRPDSPTRMN